MKNMEKRYKLVFQYLHILHGNHLSHENYKRTEIKIDPIYE